MISLQFPHALPWIFLSNTIKSFISLGHSAHTQNSKTKFPDKQTVKKTEVVLLFFISLSFLGSIASVYSSSGFRFWIILLSFQVPNRFLYTPFPLRHCLFGCLENLEKCLDAWDLMPLAGSGVYAVIGNWELAFLFLRLLVHQTEW